ncbi:MAG: prepilin peptidase [Armatimonadetes bacterium]|nr:prepilin peptidase [Armatimonadota bacterium]
MMSLDSLRLGVLVVTLAAACAADVRRRTVPNALTFPALLLGLTLAGRQGGAPELWRALAGVGVASLALLPYAGRMLGAGDVKLLWAVGALTGPPFTLWALLCSALAGGVLALAWAARRGVLAHALRSAALGGQAMLAARSARAPEGLAADSRAGRMPYAPAIALGVVAAAGLRHWGLVP